MLMDVNRVRTKRGGKNKLYFMMFFKVWTENLIPQDLRQMVRTHINFLK